MYFPFSEILETTVLLQYLFEKKNSGEYYKILIAEPYRNFILNCFWFVLY